MGVPMSDIFGAYVGHEPTIAAFLRQIIAENISPVEAMAAYDQYMASQLRQLVRPSAHAEQPRCPSCGSARTRIIRADGLLIQACHDCRWSGVIKEVSHGA